MWTKPLPSCVPCWRVCDETSAETGRPDAAGDPAFPGCGRRIQTPAPGRAGPQRPAGQGGGAGVCQTFHPHPRQPGGGDLPDGRAGHLPERPRSADRPGRTHPGHRPGAGPLLRRHRLPHLQADRPGRAGAVQRGAGDLRHDRLRPPAAGPHRPDDRAGIQGPPDRAAGRVHRRRVQHGQQPDRGLPGRGHAADRGLPPGLPSGGGRAAAGAGVRRSLPAGDRPRRGRPGRRRAVHRCVGQHGHGAGGRAPLPGFYRLHGGRRPAGAGQTRLHGAAPAARPPRGGDRPRRAGTARRRDL